jgi:isoleucyl-tRNA synthetase
MEIARTVSSIVLRVRNQIDVNVRQPLSKIILPIDKEERAVVEAVKDIILDEVNVKEIEYVEDDSGIVSKSAKPNFPVLGKRLGKQMKPVAEKIRNLTTEEISIFEEEGAQSSSPLIMVKRCDYLR